MEIFKKSIHWCLAFIAADNDARDLSDPREHCRSQTSLTGNQLEFCLTDLTDCQRLQYSVFRNGTGQRRQLVLIELFSRLRLVWTDFDDRDLRDGVLTFNQKIQNRITRLSASGFPCAIIISQRMCGFCRIYSDDKILFSNYLSIFHSGLDLIFPKALGYLSGVGLTFSM